VTHVLPMSALEVGHPVALVVLMKADYPTSDIRPTRWDHVIVHGGYTAPSRRV